MKLCQKAFIWLKKLWMRFALRRARYSNGYNYSKLNTYYLVIDPWGMTSPAEQYRFSETNRLILENFEGVKSLLEIGCGEGHQSLYIQQVCKHLIGLDVSIRAVSRAQKRCPTSKFLVGDIFCQEVEDLAPFDLVVACEVLYYMSDIHSALKRICGLSKNRFVTYYSGAMQHLDPLVLSLPGTFTEILEYKGSRWRVVWWRQA
jgi:SAM-dependent methyltransferase